jgi:uncharacterized protein YlxW (UPF0749 family)
MSINIISAALVNTKRLSISVFLASLLAVSMVAQGASNSSSADLSLQNLERERAALIQDLLSPSLDIEQRQQQLKKRQRQLTDMERMVMRDERLLSSSSTLVKNAFNQYELTFLVHAGAEQQRSAGEHWLATMNISNDAILNAKAGFRR